MGGPIKWWVGRRAVAYVTIADETIPAGVGAVVVCPIAVDARNKCGHDVGGWGVGERRSPAVYLHDTSMMNSVLVSSRTSETVPVAPANTPEPPTMMRRASGCAIGLDKSVMSRKGRCGGTL
jgi:hypothetical protein